MRPTSEPEASPEDVSGSRASGPKLAHVFDSHSRFHYGFAHMFEISLPADEWVTSTSGARCAGERRRSYCLCGATPSNVVAANRERELASLAGPASLRSTPSTSANLNK